MLQRMRTHEYAATAMSSHRVFNEGGRSPLFFESFLDEPLFNFARNALSVIFAVLIVECQHSLPIAKQGRRGGRIILWFRKNVGTTGHDFTVRSWTCLNISHNVTFGLMVLPPGFKRPSALLSLPTCY